MNGIINLSDEKKIWHRGSVLIGVDEAGRGPLAGPVVASAAMLLLPSDVNCQMLDVLSLGVNDSKKLTPKKREDIFEILTAHPRVKWAIGETSEKEIDELNILRASLLAMRRAVEKLLNQTNIWIPDVDIYLDGREVIPNLAVNQKSIIGGDGKIFSIAAASIIAKVTRDRMMLKYAKKYPQYQFDKHKGYGTKLHYEAIKKHGFSPIHRKSFLKKLR